MNLVSVLKLEQAFDAFEGLVKYPIQSTVQRRCHVSVAAQFKFKFDAFCSSLGIHLNLERVSSTPISGSWDCWAFDSKLEPLVFLL